MPNNEEIIFLFLSLAAACSRTDMGLPTDWSRVVNWIRTDNPPPDTREAATKPSHTKPVLVGKNIYQRVDWRAFPLKGIPPRPETRVNVQRLEEIVARHEHLLLEQEVKRAKRALDYLRNGAPALQLTKLKSCLVENKLASNEARSAVLKTVGDWISKGYVAGPFKEPPLDNFRVNGLIAIIKGEHYR
jgi:hypothetical protein